MRNTAKRMARCAMTAALCVVLMLLGAVLELGIYAAPLFAGLCLIPIGGQFGRKYHLTVYLAVSVLCFLLVPNPEENLMFAGLFGWYPILRPLLQRLPKAARVAVKLLVFNAVVVAVEALVICILAPEAWEPGFLWLLLALGNVTFLLYDRLIPRMEKLLERIFPKG